MAKGKGGIARMAGIKGNVHCLTGGGNKPQKRQGNKRIRQAGRKAAREE